MKSRQKNKLQEKIEMLKDMGSTIKCLQSSSKNRNRGGSGLESGVTGIGGKSYNTRKSMKPLSHTSSFSHHNFHRDADGTHTSVDNNKREMSLMEFENMCNMAK